jgi:hypothetical protein
LSEFDLIRIEIEIAIGFESCSSDFDSYPDLAFDYLSPAEWLAGSVKKFGGSAWESNPPGKFLTPHTGFEDRAAHQRPTRFHDRYACPVRNRVPKPLSTVGNLMLKKGSGFLQDAEY